MSALELALNQYLDLDEDAGVFLAPLQGKIIALEIVTFNQTVYLCPTSTRIQIIDYYAGIPDTTIIGSAVALGLMGMSSKPMNSVFSGEVQISGDLETGRQFQALFDKIDIDLEELLSRYTGDIIAHQLGRVFHQGKSWSTETLETLKLNTTEFLQTETRDLPASPEIDIFFRKVDTLRTDFDRLQSRVERINIILQEQTKSTADC